MSDKISVLLVEDEAVFRQNYSDSFSRNNIRCIEAKSIADAKRILEGEFIPEVLIVDWHVALVTWSKDIEMFPSGPVSSIEFVKSVLDRTQGRCRTIITSAVDRPLSNTDWGGAWGYFYKGGDWDILLSYIKKGFLEENEIGKPTMDLASEFARRGKEIR